MYFFWGGGGWGGALTHLRYPGEVLDTGVEAAVEQLALGVDLLQEPLGLHQIFGGALPALPQT